MAKHTSSRGFVLLVGLFALTGVATFAALGLARSMSELQGANASANATAAFHLAEGGLDNALTILRGSLQTAQVNALFNGPDGLKNTGDDGRVPLRRSAVGGFEFDTTPGPDGELGTEDDGLGYSGGLAYGVLVFDNVEPLANDPPTLNCTLLTGQRPDACFRDTDNRFWLVATTRPTTTGTIRRAVSARTLVRYTVGAADIFDNTITATRLNLDGGATLGNSTNRIRILLGGYGWDTQDEIGQGLPLEASGNSAVWAETVAFSHPGPLDTICPRCDEPGVFPVNPPPAPQFYLGQPATARPRYNVHPYFKQAIWQQYGQDLTGSGNAPDGQLDGTGDNQPWHHIKENTTLNGGTYEGIIYVEAGKWLTLKGNVTIKGTIVHEGLGWIPRYGENGVADMNEQDYTAGGINLDPGADLTIDSCASTPTHDVDDDNLADPALACGLAIIGTPVLNFKNNTHITIKGFVMAASVNAGNADKSVIMSDGQITGGLVGIWGVTFPNPNDASQVVTQTLPVDVNGDGALNDHVMSGPYSMDPLLQAIATRFASVRIAGPANILLFPPPACVPGFPCKNGEVDGGASGWNANAPLDQEAWLGR